MVVPEALSVYITKVGSLDTSGGHVWKELRNGVCKEGLACLERAEVQGELQIETKNDASSSFGE